jgi:hypothetical protein
MMQDELQQCISLATLSAVLDVGQGLKDVQVATKNHDYFILELLDHNVSNTQEPRPTGYFLGDPKKSNGSACAITSKTITSTAGIHKFTSNSAGFFAGSSNKTFSISLTNYCLYHAASENSYEADQLKLRHEKVLTMPRSLMGGLLADNGKSKAALTLVSMIYRSCLH